MAKICLINSLYEPYHRGGAEVIVKKIITGFLNFNHEVILITIGRETRKIQQGKLTIYRIKPWNIFSFLDINSRPVWLRLFWHPLDVFNFSAAKKVKNILQEEKPDAVMTHNIKGIGYLIPRVIKKLGLRHIHTIHDVQLSRPSGLILFGQEKKPFLITDKIYEKICRRFFGSPDVIVSPSRWLLDYYKRRGFFVESTCVVTPNPIIFYKVEKENGSSYHGGKINLLYAGQIEKPKGILFLVNACKKLEADNWQLTIVGSGKDQDELKNLIAGDHRFNFVGRVEPAKLIDFYRRSNLTIVPSLCYENSPTVIYESLVANVPVIASDIGGISEIVKDDYNGFTFAPGNEKNFIEVLQHFLNHPENIEHLKKNCFISVRSFSIAGYIKRLLELV